MQSLQAVRVSPERESDQLVLDQPPAARWKIHRALKRQRSKSKEQRAKEKRKRTGVSCRSERAGQKMREARNAQVKEISRYRCIWRKENESKKRRSSPVERVPFVNLLKGPKFTQHENERSIDFTFGEDKESPSLERIDRRLLRYRYE